VTAHTPDKHMKTSWPPFDDTGLTPKERDNMRDMALRRLIGLAEDAQAADVWSADDVAQLRAVVDVVRGMRWLWRLGKASVPIVALLVLMVSGWDKVVEAARALTSIGR
jgi:hypothetical protein